jgi:tetratricopeptide (TPR) repeat protein
LIIGASLLAACGSTGGVARNTPFGVDARGEGVDGLLVGHRLMAAGEAELALKAYLRAAAEQGVNVDVLSAIGSANLALGRLGQAEQILRRAVETDPNFAPALNNLGVVLMEQGKFGEARITFQQAFAVDSGESDSIRENLRLAIARTEGVVYSDPQDEPTMSLVRRGQGQYELLTEL